MAIPAITFTPSTNAISTKQACNVQFSVSENFRQFECRATLQGNPVGRGKGILIMSMSIASPNYYPANATYNFIITDQNLTQGDGTYVISLYAMNTDGLWSDAVAFEWDGKDDFSGWDFGIWT